MCVVVRSPRPSSAHDRPTDPPSSPLCRLYGHSLTRSFQLARQIPLTSPPSCLSSFLLYLSPPFSILFYFLLISTSSLPSHHPLDYIQFHNIVISSFLVAPLGHLLLIFILSACGWTLLPPVPLSHTPSSHQPRFPVLQHHSSPRSRNEQTATRLFNVVKPHSHPVRALCPADTAVVFFVTFNILTRINVRGPSSYSHRHGSHGSFRGLDFAGQEDLCTREEI